MADGSTSYDRKHHVRALQRGTAFSLLGSKAAAVAYPMLVLMLTHSPFDAGWVGCAVMAPCVVAYVPAGALVDRWSPRRALMITEFCRGFAILAVILLIGILRTQSFPWLIIPAVIEEILGVFSMLAEQCYVRRLVENDIPTPTLARGEAQTHAVIALGRPLGGILFGVPVVGPVLPFVFDFLTFIASVVILAYLRAKELGEFFAGFISEANWFHPDRHQSVAESGQFGQGGLQSGRLKSEIRDGLEWIRGDKFARLAIPLSASSSVVAQALVIIFIALADHQRLRPFFLGIALGASGFGGVVGSWLQSKTKYDAGPSRLLLLMLIWVAVLLLGALYGPQSLVTLIVVMVIFGFTGAMGNIELNTYLMAAADKSMLGRVFSIRQLFSFAAYAIGPILGGLLAGYDLSNAVRSLFFLASGIAIIAGSALVWSNRQLGADLDQCWRPPALVRIKPVRQAAQGTQLTGDLEPAQR